MPATRRKKKTRQEGSHGWGSRKKHRGKGHKGGAGKSGHGKRTNPKEPAIWKDTKYFGKYGFIKKNIKIKINPVNIRFLDENIEKFSESKQAKKENDAYIINLKDLGFNKLLGSGKVSRKLIITTLYASSRAAEAVKKAGGDVIVQKAGERKKKQQGENVKEQNKQGKDKKASEVGKDVAAGSALGHAADSKDIKNKDNKKDNKTIKDSNIKESNKHKSHKKIKNNNTAVKEGD